MLVEDSQLVELRRDCLDRGVLEVSCLGFLCLKWPFYSLNSKKVKCQTGGVDINIRSLNGMFFDDADEEGD